MKRSTVSWLQSSKLASNISPRTTRVHHFLQLPPSSLSPSESLLPPRLIPSLADEMAAKIKSSVLRPSSFSVAEIHPTA